MVKKVTIKTVSKEVKSSFQKRTVVAFLVALLTIGAYCYQQKYPYFTLTDDKVFVQDGDTITLLHQRIRLQGIDAPELKQICYLQQKAWQCGEAAKTALIQLIAQHSVACTNEGKDRYGRQLGYCFVGKLNLNAAMVRQGYALAYRAYDTSFVTEENQARQQQLGIWKSQFQNPWQWRKTHR